MNNEENDIMSVEEFTLTEQHLKLLRNMYTNWNPNYSKWGHPVLIQSVHMVIVM